MPAAAHPISSRIFGICVVLPEHVSPQTMTTGCAATARAISSHFWLIGRSGSMDRVHCRHEYRRSARALLHPSLRRRDYGGAQRSPHCRNTARAQ